MCMNKMDDKLLLRNYLALKCRVSPSKLRAFSELGEYIRRRELYVECRQFPYVILSYKCCSRVDESDYVFTLISGWV